MKHPSAAIIGITLALVLLSIGVAAAYAQTGGGYDLTWSTVDGGGATFSSSGSYTLGGTAGQPDAGVLAGGDYTLSGGFWAGGVGEAARYRIFLPLVLRAH